MSPHNLCFLGRNKKKYFPDTPSYLELWITILPLTGPGVCRTFLRCTLVFHSGSGDSSFFGVSD